jgi:hypothetical protein
MRRFSNLSQSRADCRAKKAAQFRIRGVMLEPVIKSNSTLSVSEANDD